MDWQEGLLNFPILSITVQYVLHLQRSIISRLAVHLIRSPEVESSPYVAWQLGFMSQYFQDRRFKQIGANEGESANNVALFWERILQKSSSLKIKQKPIASKVCLMPSSLMYGEDSVSRRLKTERRGKSGNGGGKWKEITQNLIKCRTTSCASTSLASVSDVVN